MTPSDERLARILLETRTIAMIGASMKPARPSHGVGLYLVEAGYRVIPVNPGHDGKTLFGETVRASIADIDEPVDLVNVFRRSEDVLPHARETFAHLDTAGVFWMQLGISNAEARTLLEREGREVVDNRCIKIEHARLIGRGTS